MSLKNETRKKAGIEKALKYIRSDRSEAQNEGFSNKDWQAAKSGKIEEILIAVLERIEDDIEEYQAAENEPEQEPEAEPRKRPGRYHGMTDGYVRNGEYYNE